MTPDEPVVATPPAEKPRRLGKLFLWGARFASLPVLALLFVSLVPAIAGFGIAPKDDRIIAVGLSVIAIGLLLAWKWAGIGGGLTLAGVAITLSQGDNLGSPDPFSIAFGLQGLLFLISWGLNLPGNAAVAPRQAWAKRGVVAILGLGVVAGAVVLLRGPGPVPIPQDKGMLVGVWTNASGFELEITADGRARVSLAAGATMDSTNCPVAPGQTATFQANFLADDRLELTSGPLGTTKAYHIDRYPRTEGKRTRAVLNATDPYERSKGFALLKK